MSVSMRVEEELYREASYVAKAECRSVARQIEFWAKIGKCALDNPDLPIEFIRDLLISKQQDRALAEPFVLGGDSGKH